MSCEYHDEISGAAVTKRTEVKFEWHVKGDGFEEREFVSVSVHDATRQGIPFPDKWRTALECTNLGNIADLSVEAEAKKTGLTHLSCTILGQPKAVSLPPKVRSLLPGGAVTLEGPDGSRIDYLLCAHIEGDRWFCP